MRLQLAKAIGDPVAAAAGLGLPDDPQAARAHRLETRARLARRHAGGLDATLVAECRELLAQPGDLRLERLDAGLEATDRGGLRRIGPDRRGGERLGRRVRPE